MKKTWTASTLSLLGLAAVLCVLGVSALRGSAVASPSLSQQSQPSLVARVGDTGFIQLTAEGFNSLSLNQKLDAGRKSQANEGH